MQVNKALPTSKGGVPKGDIGRDGEAGIREEHPSLKQCMAQARGEGCWRWGQHLEPSPWLQPAADAVGVDAEAVVVVGWDWQYRIKRIPLFSP